MNESITHVYVHDIAIRGESFNLVSKCTPDMSKELKHVLSLLNEPDAILGDYLIIEQDVLGNVTSKIVPMGSSYETQPDSIVYVQYPVGEYK